MIVVVIFIMLPSQFCTRTFIYQIVSSYPLHYRKLNFTSFECIVGASNALTRNIAMKIVIQILFSLFHTPT